MKKLLSLIAISFFIGSPLSLMAQEPIPLGPGPVTSISTAPGQSQPTINNQNPQNNQLAPIPQGPGPVIAENGVPVNPPINSQTPPPPGWGGIPGTLTIPPSADWMNQGTMNVMATGYDSEGVLQQIPMFISYQFNGVNYNITVLNAWNPYTQTWNSNVDEPAYSTSYFFNGFNYNYYTVLPTGTFYFNL